MNMTSFPQLLFSLWEAESSGYLYIKAEAVEKELNVVKGNIAVEKSTFNAKPFLTYLGKNNILTSSSIKKCEDYSKENHISLLTALLEIEVLSPLKLWRLMEDFARKNLWFLFDLHPLESTFDPERVPKTSSILFTIPTLDFIHEGIYHMKNYALIDTQIPPQSKDFLKITPEHFNRISLYPSEAYLLSEITEGQELHNLYASNLLGEKTTKKTVFALFCLGFLGRSPMSTPNKPLQEFSVTELHKILDTFNAKCSYIYKYISKELGPVALNLLEKAIQDVKPYLVPSLKNISLEADGKIDLQSVPKLNVILSDGETRQMFIKSLNEILAAEILAVKKTLGSELESVLINNLEKIGA